MRYVAIVLILALTVTFAQEIAISVASGGQMTPDVATDGENYYVVWEDTRAGTGNPNIFGRIVGSDGSLPGFETPVQSIPGYQRIPAVGFIDELYVAAWMDQTSGYAIDAKTADTMGTVSWIAFDVADASGTIQSISITHNTGGALVAWEERVSGTSQSRACVVDESETATTPVDLSISGSDQKSPKAAPYPGGWVVVYQDSTSVGKGIFAIKVTLSGALEGSQYPIIYGEDESNPSIATTGDGYIVTYERYSGTTGRDIFGILLDSSGSPSGSSFPICTESGDQTRPVVEFDGVGYLVAWQDAREIVGDIYGQRISTSGTLIGSEIAICDSSGTQQKPAIASNGSNNLVVWEDTRGATADVYGAIVPQMTAPSWPEVTVLEPLPLMITACSRNPIEMLVIDDDGIDGYTAEFTMLGDTFSLYSSAMLFSGDTLRIIPTRDLPSGNSIEVCLLDIADSLGNHLPDPVCWTFFADLDAPIASNERPRNDQVVDSFPEFISVNLADSISGVCAATVAFILNADTFAAGSPEITFDGVTARLYPPTPDDSIGTHSVTVLAGDMPDYCDPNLLEFSWSFFVNPGGGPNASTMLPKNGDVTSNPSQQVQIKITDDDGIDYETIELTHAGTAYEWSDGYMTFMDTVLTFEPPSPAAHGDEINVLLISAMDSLGNDIETPLNFSYSIDLQPPEFIDHWPAEYDTLVVGSDDVKVLADDSPAGIVGDDAHANFTFYDLSMAILESPSTGITQHADTVVLQSGAFGSALDDDSDVMVCVELLDNVDIGSENADSICWQVHIQQMAVGEMEKPEELSLAAYPNPFNATCRIQSGGPVDIFDISGRKVWSSENTNTANSTFNWTPKEELPAGIYLIKRNDTLETITVLLLK